MDEQNLFLKRIELGDLNSHYKKKKSIVIKIIDVLIFTYIFVLLCYFIFNIIFIKAQVIGISMQPTFNKNLDPNITQNYEESVYQDVVFANRFDKGKNGDIVLVEIKEDGEKNIIIKRIIAHAGQRVTLKLLGNYYVYFISDDASEIGTKLNEPYISDENSKKLNKAYFNSFCNSVPKITIVEEDKEAYIIVPENKVFVLGDNRPVSKDSHYFGPVDENSILGKVSFYYYYNENFFSFLWKQFCSIF